MMDIDALRLFAAVVRRGSFAAVAKERDVDPSVVSRSVAGLEAELGVRLLQRSTRRNEPTEAGLVFLARIEPALEDLDLARVAVRDIGVAPSGRLRITASETFARLCLVPSLPGFRRHYPSVAVEIVATDANLDLIAERIDIAIRLGPRLDVGYVGTQLFPTRYRVVAAPGAVGPFHRPADLEGCPCLRLDLPDYRDRWRFRGADKTIVTVPIHGPTVASGVGTLHAMALAGLGPALLADWIVAADVTEGRLVDLFPAYDVTATDFETAAWLLYPSRRLLAGKVRAFVDFAKARLPGPHILG